MPQIDQAIRSYLTAIEVEGKSPKTVASYANSLADFRRVGRQRGLPEAIEDYEVDHIYAVLGALRDHQRRGGEREARCPRGLRVRALLPARRF